MKVLSAKELMKPRDPTSLHIYIYIHNVQYNEVDQLSIQPRSGDKFFGCRGPSQRLLTTGQSRMMVSKTGTCWSYCVVLCHDIKPNSMFQQVPNDGVEDRDLLKHTVRLNIMYGHLCVFIMLSLTIVNM